MSGIYIHIPFCSKKCHYCNFTSIATLKMKSDYILALKNEINLRNSFFAENNLVETIYFGGGTPSLLSIAEISDLINQIKSQFNVVSNAEITLELNPENADINYLENLLKIGINRLSIGTQSFSDAELSYLGRTHNAKQSYDSVLLAKQAGFKNISIDIIFGLPLQVSLNPKFNLDKILELQIQHVSAYSLTLEEKTIFEHLVKKNKIIPPNEENAASQFEFYMNELTSNGFLHYEISNYAIQGFESKHNSAYWQNIPYLGLGASAHSFNLFSRSWNTNNISTYINELQDNNLCYEMEVLSKDDSFNDYVITSIRTNKGTSLNFVTENWGYLYFSYLNKVLNSLDKSFLLENEENRIILSNKGKLFADFIASKLMKID